MADLPGLVEGAHENRGMGHKFLKHISRTKINLFIVDINGFQLNQKSDPRSAFDTVVFLNKVSMNKYIFKNDHNHKKSSSLYAFFFLRN